MNFYRLFLLFFCALIFVTTTQNTHAYFTTAQNAFTANDTMGVYTVDFSFGHEDYDIYIPVHAERGNGQSNESLMYEILDDEKETAHGDAIGIVLGNVPVRDGMYIVPKGYKASFTLLVFFSPNETETESEFRTQVTYLPFRFDGTRQLQLNPSELVPYTTKLLSLMK